MEFKNTGKFIIWLEKVLKTETYNVQAYLKDLDKQYGETGSAIYELKGYETKSGKPECYYYEVEQIYNETDDAWQTIYTF